MNICVVIPAYHEETSVGSVVEGCCTYCSTVVVVDDGSDDRTAEAAEKAGAIVLSHAENRGKGAALRTGFQWALSHGMDGVVTLDADGQHDPADMPGLLAPAAGAGIVIGCRTRHRGCMPWSHYLTNRIMSIVVSALAGQTIADSQSGYRYLSAAVLRGLRLKTTRFDTESEILIAASRSGARIREVTARTIYGREQSKIRVFVDTVRFFRLAMSCLF